METNLKNVDKKTDNRKINLKVSQSYNQKPLFMYLFVDDYETKKKIKNLIDKFVD